jgi:hypothetical protein
MDALRNLPEAEVKNPLDAFNLFGVIDFGVAAVQLFNHILDDVDFFDGSELEDTQVKDVEGHVLPHLLPVCLTACFYLVLLFFENEELPIARRCDWRAILLYKVTVGNSVD